MDSVTVPTRIAELPTMRVTAESELMKNYLGALPAAPEQELLAVHDSESRPIVFSFSPDGRLFAIHHQEGGPTGWTQVDLTPGLPGTPITAAVGQLPGGNIFLAVGVRDKRDPSKARVAIAGPLSPDLKETDWSKLQSLWSCPPAKEGLSGIEKIVIGPVDDGRELGVPTVAVSTKSQNEDAITHFLLQAQIASDTGAPSWNWTDFPTPTVKVELLDFALGAISDLGTGIYLLYRGQGPEGGQGDGIWLVFKTLLDRNGKSFDRQLLAPAGASTLATAPGKNGTTALFVAGSGGVHWFAPDHQTKRATAVSIADAKSIPEIPRGGLVVRGDQVKQGTTSVWALSGENLLYFNDAGGNGGWSPPIVFRTGVARVAPLFNGVQYANELLYIGSDEQQTRSLNYMWQDPTTTLWKSDRIPLASTQHLYEFNCYTTHLSFEDDESGQGVAGQVLRVSASARLRVVINGVAHLIDESTSVEVTSDLQGNVTIINQVQDLAAPLLHLRADFFDGVLDVDPTHNVSDRLRKVQGAKDVPLPKTLPDKVQPDEVSNAVKSLAQLHPQSASATIEAIRYRTDAAPQGALLNTSHLPDGGGFSLSFEGGGFRMHDRASLAASFSFGGWITHAVGDAIEFITSMAHAVKHFVVSVEKGVVTFAAYLGETAVQFVVKTAEEVYKLITWVFHKIKVAFEKLIEWLGYLFAWLDIWETHKKLAAMVKNGLDYAIERADSEVASWERRVDGFFEHLTRAAKGVKIPPEIGARRLAPSGRGKTPSSSTKVLKSPGGNWTTYQLQHGGLSGSGAADLSALRPNDEHVSLLQQISTGFLSAFRDLQAPIREFVEAGVSGKLTIADLTKLAEAPLAAALEVLRPLVKAAFELVRSMLGKVRRGLDAALPIPFIGTLYKWLTTLFGSGEDLTCINGVALLVAIPLTLISKIAGHGAPFSGSRGALANAATFDQLFGPRKRLPAALRATAEDKSKEDEIPAAARGYILVGGMIASCAGLISPIIRGLYTLLAIGEGWADEGGDSNFWQFFNTQSWQEGNAGRSATQMGKNFRDCLGNEGLPNKILVGILIAFNFVIDFTQFATTIPIPQMDFAVDSVPYGLRWAAFALRYFIALIVYGLSMTRMAVDTDLIKGVYGATVILNDLIGFVFTTISNGFLLPDAEQWMGDIFSSIGGMFQGIGEVLGLSVKKAPGPIGKGVLTGFSAAAGLLGFSLGEAGASCYIALASDSAKSHGASFTNPGG